MKTKALLTIMLLSPFMVKAVIFQTIPSALKEIFHEGHEIKRKTLFLTKEQQKGLGQLIKEPIDSRLVVYYEGILKNKLQGTVFIDTHRVRTNNESVLFLVSPDGKLSRVKVLKFLEPPDYMASDRWINQLTGRVLNEKLSLRSEIHGITGATLTARALTMASRRVLALHQLLYSDGTLAADLR